MWRRQASGWLRTDAFARLTPSDSPSFNFPADVAMAGDGSRIVMGDPVPLSKPSGTYVYDRPGSGWASMKETTKLTTADDGAGLGWSVDTSADGSMVAVGAWAAALVGREVEGAVYVLGPAALSILPPATGTAGTTIAPRDLPARLAGPESARGTIFFHAYGPSPTPPATCPEGGVTFGAASVFDFGTYRPNRGFTPVFAGQVLVVGELRRGLAQRGDQLGVRATHAYDGGRACRAVTVGERPRRCAARRPDHGRHVVRDPGGRNGALGRGRLHGLRPAGSTPGGLLDGRHGGRQRERGRRRHDGHAARRHPVGARRLLVVCGLRRRPEQ